MTKQQLIEATNKACTPVKLNHGYSEGVSRERIQSILERMKKQYPEQSIGIIPVESPVGDGWIVGTDSIE